MPWTTAEADRITIRDPFPKERTLTVVAAFPWEKVQNVFVDLRYEDENNDIHEEQSITFNQESAAPKQFAVNLADPDQRLVDYRATVVYKDGRVHRIPASNTLENRVILTPSTRGHRIIRVHPEDGSFAEQDLDTMEVAIRYEDGDADLAHQQSYAFESADEAGRFEYEFAAGDDQYAYRVEYRYADGLSKSTDWTQDASLDLALPIASRQ